MTDSTENNYFSQPEVTYFIRTFGCQMNVADSLHYAEIMESLGCSPADGEETANILIVNTCSVREKAEEKAISWLGRVSGLREKRRRSTHGLFPGGIAFVGCMATVRGEEIMARFREVRTVIPARELETFEDRIIETWPELHLQHIESRPGPLLRREERYERFINIVRGCANRCTYCIVPAARGDRIESRPPSEIIDEVGFLLDTGIKSITFLGQNVCSYGSEIKQHDESGLPDGWDNVLEGYDFSNLLSDIIDRYGDRGAWFKFLTTHPKDVTDSLIGVIASHESISKHFHLPLQAGDDDVLRRMARRYKSGEYLDLIDRIKTVIPGMRLTTDIIVGFPDEDENAFGHTMEMLRKIRFDAAFTFLYSTRSGTPAAKWADSVPVDEKKRRLQELIALQNQITLERAVSKLGQERMVLVRGHASGKAGRESRMVAGITREEEVVMLPGSEVDFGKFVRVRLIKANLRSFTAERPD